MFSALLLSADALSDRVGAHRAYSAGMVLFLLASTACGLAPMLPVLIGAGRRAALITPTSLALIPERTTTRPGGRAR
jgi:MFS transporter, DHA2 family, methylenomycin A resistance protein